MVNSTSNYMNNVGSLYKYNYNQMRSVSSVYNTAGINKPSPTEKTSYVNNDAVSYLSNIRTAAGQTLDSLNNLSNVFTFNKMQAVSANSDYLTVNSDSKATSAFRDTQVEIKQTATAQVNEGNSLRSDGTFGDAGTRQFEIEQDGKRFQFSVEVGENDTNRDVQQKMADAVNSRNIGVTATVSENKDDGTSALSFLSRNTGADNGNDFTVRDVTGSLASATGVNRTTQSAQDAVYRINNGATQTSKTNNVSLGNGVSVTLQKATAGTVAVKSTNDTATQVGAVKKLVDSYNAMFNAAKSGPANNRLLNDLNGVRDSYAPSLERLGITANKDGTLKVDDTKLGAAAENGSLASFLGQTGSANYGFTNRLTRIADNVQYNSQSYAGNTVNNAAQSQQSSFQSALETYKQNTGSYNYAYSYNAPGTLFNLYA